ncbi:MAG: NTP transferase domain-containing protein [Magnetococcales bacterium]|nr:NTP transferase domain-containing protein [Magnetococcales bacterium]
MKRIWQMGEVADSVRQAGLDRAAWTAIIPAAGEGSRLGYHRPKILYPLLGRPILHWLIDLLTPFCGKMVFVLSSQGEAEVAPLIQERLGEQGATVIQERPTGMGDAVGLARDVVTTPQALVVWGDQVLLSPSTLANAIGLHTVQGAALTLASVMRDPPYIRFERDGDERLLQVHQVREGEGGHLSGPGENDCGLFLFRVAALFPVLARGREAGIGLGKETGEFNLLQVLPFFEQEPGGVMTLRIGAGLESMGVNTREEAEVAEKVLQERVNASPL